MYNLFVDTQMLLFNETKRKAHEQSLRVSQKWKRSRQGHAGSRLAFLGAHTTGSVTTIPSVRPSSFHVHIPIEAESNYAVSPKQSSVLDGRWVVIAIEKIPTSVYPLVISRKIHQESQNSLHIIRRSPSSALRGPPLNT